MITYHPTPAELAEAETYFGQIDAPAHDDCVDSANRGQLPQIAQHIGKAPVAVAEAIALGQEISMPIPGINDPLTRRGMTLLHLAALLYSKAASSYAVGSRDRAQYYERVCRLLLDAGADPHARMSMDGFFKDLHTPAAICNGAQPLCLRARMLREAAEGRCKVKSRKVAYTAPPRVSRKSKTTKRRIRQARGVTDTGKGWLVQAQDGVEVGLVAYDPAKQADRWSKHRVAILAREQYEHRQGFSNARLRSA